MKRNQIHRSTRRASCHLDQAFSSPLEFELSTKIGLVSESGLSQMTHRLGRTFMSPCSPSMVGVKPQLGQRTPSVVRWERGLFSIRTRVDPRPRLAKQTRLGSTVLAVQRPDFNQRSTWSALFRQVASISVSDSEQSGRLEGPPPIRSVGEDDPSIEAWSIAMEPMETGAAARLLTLLGPVQTGQSAPMLASRDDLAIEVWTECELSVVHAAWRILIAVPGDPGSGALRSRVVSAVAWHLEHTQPDNATTHPWGVHAFLELGTPWLEASDYAASMIHAVEAAGHLSNEQDPLWAWILRDAAEGLDLRELEDFGG